MPSFSQRHGYISEPKAAAREEVSATLRTLLWNVLNAFVWRKWTAGDEKERDQIRVFFNLFWITYLKRDLDDLPPFKSDPQSSQYGPAAVIQYHSNEGYDVMKAHFLQSKWNEALDFLEYIISSESLVKESVVVTLNEVFKSESSAYRILDKQIVEVMGEEEVQAVEKALTSGIGSVKEHLSSALRLLNDRENPDFRNSIKESISAVEAECRRVTGDEKATLGKAVKKIGEVHPALSEAFSKLYGYTNDSDGIRHAMLDEPDVKREDARFMLVACSAFIGLLRDKIPE